MPAPPAIAFGFSSASKHERTPMHFTKNWGEGDMFAWYGRRRQQSKGSVIIERLQIRIDNGTPPHRFVLAFMKDGTIFRFDRRPETSKIGALISETLGPAEHRKAGDDYCWVLPDEIQELERGTHREIELNLPEGTDLLLVLSAAFAIANDEEACKYNLATYNCYFFSWTIIMIVARHAIPFTMPPSQKVVDLLKPAVSQLSSSLTRKIVDALLSLVLDTITTFRRDIGRSLNKGLGKRELMVWGLPTSVVRFLMKGCIKMRLNFGMEKHLKDTVTRQLQKHMKPILDAVLTNQGPANDNVKTKLWIDQLKDAFGPPVRKQLLEIVWAALLEALKDGCGDLDSKEIFNHIAAGTSDPNGRISTLFRLKYTLLGPNVVQFARVWNEALHDALPAASSVLKQKDSAAPDPASTINNLKNERGLPTASEVLKPENSAVPESGSAPDSLGDERKLHKEMFDGAFTAASKAALEAAQRVVSETASTTTNSKRDEMWEIVWAKWEGVWDSARDNAEGMVISLITDTMTEIVDLVAMKTVVAVGSNESQPVDAAAHHRKQEDHLLSWSAFQTRIAEYVRSAVDSKDAVAAVENNEAQPVDAAAHHKQPQKDSLSNLSAFQARITKHVRSVADPRTQTATHLASIQEAMTRAWLTSRETYTSWDEIEVIRRRLEAQQLADGQK
ncbi:hypothetical protein B0J17DRAFT_719522 [Rhizoctonia solani]|nr:hypothetical protein B0J17DRAFT_719522 [Rhizoctonia solani]